jgi:spermidine synthase
MPRYRLPLCAALALALTAAGAQAQEQRTIHQERSLYRNISVVQTGDERCMLFRARRGLGRESCMLVSNPDKLVFEYAPMMLSSLFLNPNPRRVLVIGQGGGTLPTALQKMVPDAAIDVVEIDGAVDRIARQYFDFKPGPRTRVFIEDGRVFVKRAARDPVRYDLVMLDAFEADYIPEHMLTQEFLQEVKAIMTPNGVLAANTFSSSALYDHESTTSRSVFGTFYNLKLGNRVILARLGGLPDTAAIRANAAKWAAEYRRRGADADSTVTLMDIRTDWDQNARILTDQYSPSNVLNTLPRGN